MTRRATRTPAAIATELDAPERILLFCLATGTRVGTNTAFTRSRLIVRGLIERDGSRLKITDQGRAVLTALLEEAVK